MTRIVEWAVGNTRVVIATIAVVLIAGLLAFMNIPKEADPDIPIPVIVVQASYPGISPEDGKSGFWSSRSRPICVRSKA